MGTVRVLVVEDSSTVRNHLCQILSGEPEIEVVGRAIDGKQAIELCQQLRPDVLTLDMMLPTMSGLAATEYIMAYCPTPILIVSSSINRGELFKTYEALAAGAVDVLEKPRGDDSDVGWEQRFVSAVRMAARIRVITHPRGRLGALGRADSAPAICVEHGATRSPSENCEVVAVGASTGGPGAIVEVMRALPLDFALPVLLVLHIGEPFGQSFADWLDGQTARPVAYATEGQSLSSLAGRVAMAPAGRHLTVRGGRLRLDAGQERHSCRPSIDVLFESLARECGRRAAACLLTGMGRDGAAGLLEMRVAGAFTIAQDEATSVVYGMPREAALLRAAVQILPLDEIAPAIAALGGPRAARRRS
jgi:two-component system, chemotaxis family, protein-glutamate methylesterase/glutaminase